MRRLDAAFSLSFLIRSEHKPLMRLAALGTAAVALMVVVILMCGALVIIFCMGAPAMGRMARPWAIEQVTAVEKSVKALEGAQAEKDWPAMQEHATEATSAMTQLTVGPAATSLVQSHDGRKIDEMRAHIKDTKDQIVAARQAIRDRDAEKLTAALREFHRLFEPVREAARKPRE